MELHIPPNGLQRWLDKFLADFHEEFGNFDENVLEELKFKLEVYQNLFFAIKQNLALVSDKLGYRIIRAKILNPHMSVE